MNRRIDAAICIVLAALALSAGWIWGSRSIADLVRDRAYAEGFHAGHAAGRELGFHGGRDQGFIEGREAERIPAGSSRPGGAR